MKKKEKGEGGEKGREKVRKEKGKEVEGREK